MFPSTHRTKDNLFATTDKLAREIIKSAPLPVGAFKKIINRGQGVDLMTHLDMEASMQSIMIRSEDFKECVTALMEKRDPVWKKNRPLMIRKKPFFLTSKLQ